ncbi:MAG TPA: hypothetical protein VFZ23_16260 [Pyrinomonadaceae bacterium]
MKSEGMMDEIVLASYSRSQRVSRMISVVVTLITIVVGASLVGLAAVTTARYYSARNEIDQLNLQIRDLSDKLLAVQTPGEQKPQEQKVPIATITPATPTPLPERIPDSGPATPCNEANLKAELAKAAETEKGLNEKLSACQRDLKDCQSGPKNPGGVRPGTDILKKTPAPVQ